MFFQRKHGLIKNLRTSFLVLLMILGFSTKYLFAQDASQVENIDLNSSKVKDLYVDPATGQVFTLPGPNRKKIVLENNEKSTKAVDPPSVFASRPDDILNEKLTIAGRVQFRGISGEEGSVYSNGKSDFKSVDMNFRRLRLGFIYEGNKWWGAMTNLRLENAMNSTFLRTRRDAGDTYITDVTLANARGLIQEAGIWVKFPFMKTKISVGALNVPFQREFIMTSANLMNIERSLSTFVLPQFDNGISIQSHLLKPINERWEKLLTGSFMIGNGHGGPGDFGYGRRIDLADERPNAPKLLSPSYYGRLQWNPLGGLERDGKDLGWIEGEEIFQRNTKLSIGTAFASLANVKVPSLLNPDYWPANVNQPSILQFQTTRDGGEVGAPFTDTLNKTNPGRPKLGVIGHTYDYTFTSHGFYSSAAYSIFNGSAAPQHLRGHSITMGYIFSLGNGMFIMPIGRFDYFQGDFNWNKNLEPFEAFRSYWIGLNLFGDKHVFKAQLFYQIFNDKFNRDYYTNRPIDVNDNVLYFQIQANFWTGTMTPERFTRLE